MATLAQCIEHYRAARSAVRAGDAKTAARELAAFLTIVAENAQHASKEDASLFELIFNSYYPVLRELKTAGITSSVIAALHVSVADIFSGGRNAGADKRELPPVTGGTTQGKKDKFVPPPPPPPPPEPESEPEEPEPDEPEPPPEPEEPPIPDEAQDEAPPLPDEPDGDEEIISDGAVVDDDTDWFTPQTLDDFIGQEHIVKRIRAEINAAKKQGLKHMDNILLFGNRGLGKSTLMELIAKELGVKFEFIDAAGFSRKSESLESFHRFLQAISAENVPVVIAIDEVHALPTEIQTGLLTLLNSRKYSYLDKSGKTHVLPVDEFTFIAATTDSDKVLPTIKDRCSNLTFYLKDYTPDELERIFVKKFSAKGLSVTRDALTQCVKRCRSSIREVESFVKGMRTKAINSEITTVNTAIAQEYFAEREIDPIGLTNTDLRILRALRDDPSGVMSADTLAARVHIDPAVLVKEFEPYLIKIGFISINSRGRSLTERAVQYIKDGTVGMDALADTNASPVPPVQPQTPVTPSAQPQTVVPPAPAETPQDIPPDITADAGSAEPGEGAAPTEADALELLTGKYKGLVVPVSTLAADLKCTADDVLNIVEALIDQKLVKSRVRGVIALFNAYAKLGKEFDITSD